MRKLNSRMYPARAATPIQYHFASVKTPQDLRMVIPNDSVVPGRIWRIESISSYRVIMKAKKWIILPFSSYRRETL